MKIQAKKKQKLIDINITPFVDIVLVLLIIFMVTTPMMTNEIKVNLPSAKTKETQSQNSKKINININSNGEFVINGSKVSQEEIQTELSKFQKDDSIFIYADKDVKYEFIIKLLENLQKAELSNTSFVVKKS